MTKLMDSLQQKTNLLINKLEKTKIDIEKITD